MNNKKEYLSLLSQGTEFIQNGQPQKGIPYLEQAYKLVPESLDVGLNLGGAYILTKKFKKAEEVLKPLSVQWPNESKVWINLGAAYLGNPVLAKEQDQNLAISAFKRALEIDPVAHSVAYNIGLIYKDRQDYKKAEYWFNMAVKHNPHDKDARRLLEKMKIMENQSKNNE